jgi:aspartyl-tRNA(Asn)/glutamyl-tRNA(Gln) amidotransferase subunit B
MQTLANPADYVSSSGVQWEVVIGLETHTQLLTKSKAFSGSSTQFGAAPNTQANVFDVAMPGVLPVMNRQAVECAIRFGLSIGAKIEQRSIFARKNYFYPDLPKGYQISQYELPVVQGGQLAISWEANGQPRTSTIALTRAHLEEDAGKSLHEDFDGMSGIDLNRAGTPLLEIVTEPDMRSAKEAVAYAKALHGLVTWLGICDGNLQEGSFRCDANVSVRPVGQKEFGTRCEIKNLNSFRFLERAIDFEVRRQIELNEDGGKVVQETRLYDPDRDETRSMRSKEDAHDYRYFPDPDLPPLVIESSWIEASRAKLPELPHAMANRLKSELGLSDYDAGQITANRAQADFFERALTSAAQNSPSTLARDIAKPIANLMIGDLAAQLNRDSLDLSESPVSAAQIAQIAVRIKDGTISSKGAKEIFQSLWESPDQSQDAKWVDHVIDSKGLKQVSDSGALVAIITEVLRNNPAAVDEFKAGKEKAFNALVGQIMKASKGKANPQQVHDLLKAQLNLN